MKTAVMLDIGTIGFEDRPIPTPAAGEVLVRIAYVGVCGSDLHYFEHGRIGDFVVEPPFVLGHEASGVVQAVGEGVTDLVPGDRVALEPGKTCGHCEFCTTGRYHLCPEVIFFATPPVDGVFAEYATHPASLCFKLPEGVSLLAGALIEPLAVGLHAANQGGAGLGQTALVFGAGCIGLVSLLALSAKGVTRVTVTDLVQRRLDKALSLGADSVINGAREDTAARCAQITGGRGFDLIIEASGNEAALRQAIAVAKKGATIVLVGYPASGEMTLPVSEILNKELTLKSVFRYHHVYPMAIEAVRSGRVDLEHLVTDVFDFDDLQNALDRSVGDKENIVKSAIRISKE